VKNNSVRSLFLLFILSLLMMLRQLLVADYFYVIKNDVYTYTNWAWQFTEAFQEGIIYPRWLPLNFWGYGGPIFILYPPLAFYLTTFFNFFTNSLISAMNLAKFTALFFSTAGMFFLVKEFYSEKIALFSAFFYLIFPYTIFQFYVVGQFSSVISFMWFPPILLFTYRYLKRNQVKDMLYAGFYFSGLICTHLINAYMLSFVILILIIYFAIVQKKPSSLIAIPVIFITGFLISSAYTLPVIFENKFLSLSSFIGEGSGFHYADFFILPGISDRIPADDFWPEYYPHFFSYLFLFLGFLISYLFCWIGLRRSSEKIIKEISFVFIIISILSLFLLLSISSFLWETIPFFKYIQFPARWLNITNFTISFLSSILFWSIMTPLKTKRRMSIFMVVICLTMLLVDFKYVKHIYTFPQQKLIPVQIQNSNLEHLPIWAAKDNIYSNTTNYRIEIVEGEGESEILVWKSAERIINIIAEEPIVAKIQTFYFPGWKAYLNGTEIRIDTEAESGAILVNIPKGHHMLMLKFVDTPVRCYGKLISLLSLVALGCFLLRDKFRE
jgi:uncharacterized membrane protein